MKTRMIPVATVLLALSTVHLVFAVPIPDAAAIAMPGGPDPRLARVDDTVSTFPHEALSKREAQVADPQPLPQAMLAIDARNVDSSTSLPAHQHDDDSATLSSAQEQRRDETRALVNLMDREAGYQFGPLQPKRSHQDRQTSADATSEVREIAES